MSLLSASIRVPLSLPNELAASSSVVEGDSSLKSAPRANFLRRTASLGSFKKASVHQKFQKVSRALLTPRGWSSKLIWEIVSACVLIVFIAVLQRNSMCPISMLLHRLQVSARHGEHAIRSVAVQVAHELINAGHHCLDVRTVEEYNAGHVEGALNIPYLVKCGPGMSKNHRFLEEVKAQFGKDDEIIVGCQSGRRSMMAAAELLAANFTGITDMGGGYLAWKESGLPTKNPKQASKYSV